MTISKKQKEKQKILDALKDKAELSNDNPGPRVIGKRKLNIKDRRHYGRVTPKIVAKGKVSELVQDALEPQVIYDDWVDPRDGFRGDLDSTKLRKKKNGFWYYEGSIQEINTKIQKQLAIKKAMKNRKGKQLI